MDKNEYFIGDIIYDCYMNGIGELSDIGSRGQIEAIGRDWVIVRNVENNHPILVDRSPQDLYKFLKNQ